MYSPGSGAGSAYGARGASERRFALKRATNAAHARVESIVQAAGSFDSIAGYRRYLAATWQLRDRFERLLDMNGAARLWPEWPERRIAGLAAQDLADLGGRLPHAENDPQSTLTDGELLGVLYVLEGSSLGARVLVRMVGALGLSANHGAHHLHAQAGDTAAWRSFLDVLDASAQPPSHEAALMVFDAFGAGYERACG